MTANRGMRLRLVLAPRRLPANRRTAQATAAIRAKTATNAKMNVSGPCIPGPRQIAFSSWFSLAAPLTETKRTVNEVRDQPNLLISQGKNCRLGVLITHESAG